MAKLQLRRGNDGNRSILDISEPYFNSISNALEVGFDGGFITLVKLNDINSGSILVSDTLNTNILISNEISGSLFEGIGNLVTFSSSLDARIDSLGSSTTDINEFTASANFRLNSLETESGSIRSDFTNYTSSNDTRIGIIENYTSSLKTAIQVDGDNLIVIGNLTVQGTETILNTETLVVEDNIIEINGSGATFGGIHVNDSTAPNYVTGSLIWDSINDHWLAGQSGSEERILRQSDLDILNTYTSSADFRLNSLEVESGSIRSDFTNYTSSADSRLGSLETESGSIRADFNEFTSSYTTGSFTGSFSGDGSGLSGVPNEVLFLDGLEEGLDNGAVTVTLDTGSVHFNEGIKKKLNIETVISGSSQVQLDSVDGFTAYSSSIHSHVNVLETYTSSFDSFTSTYNTGSFTGSFDGDFTGSLKTDIITFDLPTFDNGIDGQLGYSHNTSALSLFSKNNTRLNLGQYIYSKVINDDIVTLQRGMIVEYTDSVT